MVEVNCPICNKKICLKWGCNIEDDDELRYLKEVMFRLLCPYCKKEIYILNVIGKKAEVKKKEKIDYIG